MMGLVHKNGYRRAAALLLAALLLALAGCSSEPKPAQLRQGQEMVIAVTDEPDSLNPLLAESKLAQEFMLLVYDPLWRIDASGQPVNCLAEDYSLSSDQRTWTVRLRDVTFSDGTPLTSADVKYSYETMNLYSTVYAPYCEGISDIRCPDDRTVVFTTEYVKGDMLYCPIPILPRSIWNKASSARTFENEEMIGTGPFVRQLVDRGPQEMSWTFQAREDYFGGPAKMGSVRFLYYATESGAARALSTGEVDAAVGLTDVQLTTLEGVPGVDLIHAMLPISDIWVVAFNTRSDMFSDTATRQMVEYSTDRSWMVSMSGGGSDQAGSVFALPKSDYFGQVVNLRGLDRDSAKNILYTVGYNDIDDDGVMENQMTRGDLVVQLYTSSQDDWAPTAATVLKDNLETIGVRVQWNVVDGPVEDVCTPKARWDMCLVTWRGNANPVIAADYLRASTSSLTGWESKEYEQTLQNLRQTLDRDAACAVAVQLQQIAYNDCPCLVLTYCSDIQGFRDDRWTGCEDVLNTAGGLFFIGSVDGYMALTPAEKDK